MFSLITNETCANYNRNMFILSMIETTSRCSFGLQDATLLVLKTLHGRPSFPNNLESAFNHKIRLQRQFELYFLGLCVTMKILCEQMRAS